ncbi:AAA family ATPase [Streptomyces sediminimaris]|uniref:AAA family ATPase n=1 Tax=Streptomyces sediminimaris TaxID=3383721 RepID=UPI00399BF4E8
MTGVLSGQPVGLLGRAEECATLDRLLQAGLGGESGVLVLRGDAGVGKTALIAYVSRHDEAWRTATVVGVESEMELDFSGVHQLCAPFLGYLERLPDPQRVALQTVFGLRAGSSPDRFLVALSTLTLLAEAAEEQPLLCLVDDAHWLDAASTQILGFVARRLLAERIVIVCAARTGAGGEALANLPQLTVSGLDDSDARALLLASLAGPLDAAIRDQIVAESHGNPLALLELPRTWKVAELAGGFGFPGDQPVAGKIEQSYSRRLLELPRDTQSLVLVAAAEPQGDPVLLHRAAGSLGLEMSTAAPAIDAGLMRVGRRVEFGHPLVRTAAYHSARSADRERVHLALAEVTDAERDPDRRAWHRAHATAVPDEDVAAELERSAGRAQARGGLAAAAAFLHRAVSLTPDRTRRVERALAAAEASLQAGAFDVALGLAAAVETASLNDLQRARVDLVRGRVAFASNQGRDAPPLLLAAAKRLEPLAMELARETYLDAWGAALYAGDLAVGGDLVEVSRAAQRVPPSDGAARPAHLLLAGLAALVTGGHDAAAATLRKAQKAIETESTVEISFRWGWLTVVPSIVLWEDRAWHAITERQLRRTRQMGALARLPIDLTGLALTLTWRGEFAAAASAMAEADVVSEATGVEFAPLNAMHLAALRGHETELRSLVGATTAFGTARGQGNSVLWTHWVTALLFNGLARYEEALASAQRATRTAFDVILPGWALPELVEASVKTRRQDVGQEALERFEQIARAVGTDWALGLEARCRALLNVDESADELYRLAIERLDRTPLRTELARAHLLYGEWLRRERRRLDARGELRTAYEMFAGIGMEGFAERARRELAATGDKARKRTLATRDDLTPQEQQIARLARGGLSNPEIGAQLFLSARTVEWHLRKVFVKLDISSRRQLRTVISPEGELVRGRTA